MIEQINQNLRQIVPLYGSAVDLTVDTYKKGAQKTNYVINQVSTQVSKSKQDAIRIRQQLQNSISEIVESASNELLTRAESYLLVKDEMPSESEKKQIKKRFENIFNTIINSYVLFYASEAKNFNLALVKQGQQYIYTNIFPLYIRLKATVLVSKEILIELVQNRLDDMKMTYQVSKDNVTMLIRGKFDEQKIIQKINSGMQNFKELTVRVVKKGLEIKVDKQSLYENYEIFSLKLIQVVKQMRQKGAQRIVSAKQRTTELYQNVLNRIREKQITLRIQSRENEQKQHEKVQ